MLYSDFRRQFGGTSPILPKKMGLNALWFWASVAAATALVLALISLSLAAYEGLLIPLALATFVSIGLSWRTLDRQTWQIDDSRYLSAPDPAKRRELWYQHRALGILRKEQVSATGLDYLVKAAERGAELAERKTAYIGGLVLLIGGWWFLLFEGEFGVFIVEASSATKIVLSVYLMGFVAIFAPVFLNQRFSSLDRIIENTLYDISQLGLYQPHLGSGQAPRVEAGRDTGATAQP